MAVTKTGISSWISLPEHEQRDGVLEKKSGESLQHFETSPLFQPRFAAQRWLGKGLGTKYPQGEFNGNS